MTARAFLSSLRFFPESTNRLPPTHKTSLFLYYFALLLYSFISYTPTQLNTTPHESSKLSPSMSVGAGRGCRLQGKCLTEGRQDTTFPHSHFAPLEINSSKLHVTNLSFLLFPFPRDAKRSEGISFSKSSRAISDDICWCCCGRCVGDKGGWQHCCCCSEAYS